MDKPDMIMPRSGAFVYFDDAARTAFSWNDVLISLSGINRYNGGIQWNLLRHHLLVWDLAKLYAPESMLRPVQKKLIVHDIHECYVGDLVSGLKRFCPDFSRIELEFEYAVWDWIYQDRSDFTGPWIECAKSIDSRAVVVETACTTGEPIYRHLLKNGAHALTKEEAEIFDRIAWLYTYEAEEELADRISESGGKAWQVERLVETQP